MSMDISVWSERAPNLPQDLPQEHKWDQFKDSFELKNEDWMISVDSSPQNARPEVIAALPAARFETCACLSPIGASEAAYKVLEVVVRTVCRATSGYWLHPGDGRLYRYDQGRF